jgi:RNA polymerase sigma-70 factor (ECF subfamily)
VLDDVWRYCWSLLGDRHLADEATQETFLRATTAIRRFRGDAPVKAWLFVIARRATADVLDRHRRTIDLRDQLPPAPPTPSHGGAVEMSILIEDLDPDTREAFVLTQINGLTYADAARVAGCPVGTIRSRVFRARDTLIAAHSAVDDMTVTSLAEGGDDDPAR